VRVIAKPVFEQFAEILEEQQFVTCLAERKRTQNKKV
jgi:hypothetical protein